MLTDWQLGDQVPNRLEELRAASVGAQHAEDGVEVFVLGGDHVLWVQFLMIVRILLNNTLLEMVLHVLIVPIVKIRVNYLAFDDDVELVDFQVEFVRDLLAQVT